VNTLFIIWLVIAAISITAYFIFNANSEPEEDFEDEFEFQAVTIAFNESEACEPVKKLAGRRLISDASPLLPLTDCTAKNCNCTYRHYDDRRQGCQRLDDKSVIKRLYRGTEQRVEQRGRREEDAPDDILADTFENYRGKAYETHSDTYYDYVDQTGSMQALAEREDASESEGPVRHDSHNPAAVAPFTPAETSQDSAPISPVKKKSGRSRS
jgi:hypothetical protein